MQGEFLLRRERNAAWWDFLSKVVNGASPWIQPWRCIKAAKAVARDHNRSIADS